MSNSSKRERAEAADPNRFKQAKQMSVVPGGPMNNTPQNVASIGDQRMTLDGSPPQYPYQDSAMDANDFRTRAPIPNENSGMPQFMVIGNGLNKNPYGLQPQPDPVAQNNMDGSYMGTQAQNRGLYASMMGPTGMPTQTAPGGSTPQPQQTAQALPLQGVQSAEIQPQAQGKGTDMKSGNRTKTA